MRYAQIRSMDISNGEGIGVSLYVQGCPIHCKGCFNPDTWNFNDGDDFTEKELFEIIELIKEPYIKRLSIVGGEPLALQNIDNVLEVIFFAKENKPSLKIWVWSGYTWEEIQQKMQFSALIKVVDYLVVGPFVQEEKDLTLLWRGSRNQEIIDVKETIKQGEKILYDA